MKIAARRTTALAVSFAFAFAFALAVSARAEAAPEFVDRPQTLAPLNFAIDLGMGVGHYDLGRGVAGTGPGVNAELAIGIVRHLELGFRQGLRFGDEGRFASADVYGRLYDWKSFELGGGTLTNPEARVRGQLIELEVLELSLEGRLVLPFAEGTRAGAMFGVPIALHLGRIVRIDTGAYLGFVFRDGTPNSLILPVDAWFQVTERFWLGPRTGIVLDNPDSRTHVPLGFGLGYQFARIADFKAGFLFPAVDHDRGSTNFGVGAGVQIRIE